jgi:two-component sensor histidine kinase
MSRSVSRPYEMRAGSHRGFENCAGHHRSQAERGANCRVGSRRGPGFDPTRQITALAREAEHRAKNLLANVKAMVHLSRASTPEDLKEAIEGRIEALANVHSLFAGSRSTGTELRTLIGQELSPYCKDTEGRTRIDGPAFRRGRASVRGRRPMPQSTVRCP